MSRCQHIGKLAQKDGKARNGAWIVVEVEVGWNCLLLWGIQTLGSEIYREVLTSTGQKCNWRCGVGREKTKYSWNKMRNARKGINEKGKLKYSHWICKQHVCPYGKLIHVTSKARQSLNPKASFKETEKI